MRYLVFGLCLVMAGCADARSGTPLSPSSTTSGATQTRATGGSDLPFSGTVQTTETESGATRYLTGTGEATYLGQFTLSEVFTVGSATPYPATWTAANGDQIFAEVTAKAVVTFPTVAITETDIITDGTGRFGNASGTLIVERSLNILTHASSGTMSGTISLGH